MALIKIHQIDFSGSASYTGSLQGTASYALQALSSSYAITASFALNVPTTASYAISSSYAVSASYALNTTSASYAQTASYALQALSSSYSQTSSFVVLAQSASYVLNAISSSFSTTASYIQNAQSASYVLNAISSSFSTTASYAVTASYAANVPATASYALQALSSSYALTASFALNGGSGGGGFFIATGSVSASVNLGTGSFTITSGSTNLLFVNNLGRVGIGTTVPSSSLHVVGNTILSGSVGSGSALTVYKSGSTVVDIQGSSGQLFSITDSLTGSLFSVNTVAGLPVVEAFSDNTVNIGKFGIYPIKVVATGSLASITGSFTGSFAGNIIGIVPSASYALTASFVNPLTQSLLVSGSATFTNALTASSALITGNVVVLGTASINTLVVNQTQLSTGSNQLGDAVDDFQTLYGTVRIPTGSLTVTGSTFISSSNPTQLQIGNNLLFVSSSGNIGIGTTSPSYKLTVASGDINLDNGSYRQTNPNTFFYRNIGDTYESYINFTYGNYDFGRTNFGTAVRLATNASSPNSYFMLGNLGVGTTTPTFKLDVSGSGRFSGNLTITGSSTNSLLVKGSGATSATNALLVQNSSGTSLFTVGDTGAITATQGDLTTNTIIASGLQARVNQNILINAPWADSTNVTIQTITNRAQVLIVRPDADLTLTSGTHDTQRITQTFAPTSGTGVVSGLTLNQTINQTGGANGITRGLYVNPTLTAAADFRAIETTSGSVLFNGGRVNISGSASTSSALLVYKSGSTVLDIQGSQGSLMSVEDSLTGSLMSVGNISGLPLMEVFDDGTMNMGKFNVYPIKIINTGSLAVITGSFTGSFVGSVSGTATSASYALTASFVNPLTQSLLVSGSATFTNALTASSAIITGNVTVLGTASINTLVVNQTQLSTGSNQLGDNIDDFQTLYGTVRIPTGSLIVTGSTIISSSAATQLLVGSSSLFVSSSGNVGIGTIIPTQKLHVNSSDPTTRILIDNTNVDGAFTPNAGFGLAKNGVINWSIAAYSSNFNFTFFNDFSNSAALLITRATNNIGIGTTTDSGFKLDVNGTGRFSGNLTITGSSTNSLLVKGSGTTSATNALLVQNSSGIQLGYIDDSGQWQIGTGTNGGYKLDVSGSTRVQNTLTVGNVTFTPSGNNITIQSFGSTSNVAVSAINNRYFLITGNSNTTGNGNAMQINTTFGSTSGIANYTTINLTPTINTSGTYTGIYTGIYYGPTLTSLTGITDHIAFQSTSGRMIVGGNVSASGSIARGVYFNNNLIASASNDTLVGLDINPTFTTGSFTNVNRLALRSSGNALISGSVGNASALSVYKSGSTVLDIQGSQGQLFSITDSLSGSLFSVSNISGLPILEVFSDNTTLVGNYLAPALITTYKATINSGSTVIYSMPTSSYDGAFFDYTLKSGSNARAGQIVGIWSETSASFTETTTVDFGNTSTFNFGMYITGSNMVLSGSATTSGWTLKTIIRTI
jgi:hypothetical protein